MEECYSVNIAGEIEAEPFTEKPSLKRLLDIGANPIGLFFIDSQVEKAGRGTDSFYLVRGFDRDSQKIQFVDYRKSEHGYTHQTKEPEPMHVKDGENTRFPYWVNDLVWVQEEEVPESILRSATIYAIILGACAKSGIGERGPTSN